MPKLLLDRLMRRVVGVIVAGLRPLGRLLNGELLALLQAGGFGALESMVEGWLSGSRGAALAIASVLFIVGVLVKFTPGLSRRMREGGMETLENGLFIVGVVAFSAAIFALVVSIATSFGGQSINVESPWR